MNVYDFTVKDTKGTQVSLSKYTNQVLLIVNTATACGFTSQYSGLQELYEKYKDKGFEILDFPCNQFGNQAPGNIEEIVTFCTGRFGITFPQFDKIDVNGEKASPLFRWLKEQKGGVGGENIKWNFTKFLLDKNGEVVSRHAPTKTAKALDKEIAKLL